jgi:nucleotide-binding universal stress UspA family protein
MVSKILVPLDCTEIAEAGLRWAEQVARRSGAAVHLLSVVDLAEPDVEKRAKAAEAYLQSRRDQLKAKGLNVKMEVAAGEPAQTIIERGEGVDLTVVSSGTVRWLISAVLDRVLENMTRPLVVVRASQTPDMEKPATERILVALDQADYSSEIIPVVQSLAKALSASVTLCHAVAPNVDEYGRPAKARPGSSADPLEQAELFIGGVARQFENEGIATETVVAIGDPPGQIVRTAQRTGAGLIALTTRGRDRLDSRLGGTANAILHSTRLPCLLTRRLPVGAGAGGSPSSAASVRSPGGIEESLSDVSAG